MELKRLQYGNTARRIVPGVALVALGALGLGVYGSATSRRVTSTPGTSSLLNVSAVESPAPVSVDQHVIVNGKEVPIGGSGTTTVQSSDDGTTSVAITSTTSNTPASQTVQSSSRSSNSGNLNVSVNSSSGGGSSWGFTQVTGTSFSTSNNGTSNGFSSTNIMSTDGTNLNVSQ